MNVTLLAHTQLSDRFYDSFDVYGHSYEGNELDKYGATDGQIVSLAAIRQCYSHKTAIEVLETESEKYFGEKGKEGKRLFNQIYKSGHTSTLEHISFTFAIDGVSRSLLAQLTRHRHMSFSVKSQRYNNFSMGSRAEGFTYAIPNTINGSDEQYFDKCMLDIQLMYDKLISLGIPQEDARAVLPNAVTCDLVLTANLRTILEFYQKRRKGNGAQHEITELAERMKEEVIRVEPFTKDFFDTYK